MDVPEVLQTRRTLRIAIIQTVLLAVLTGGLLFLATNIWLNYSIDTIKNRQRSNLTQIVTVAHAAISPILQRMETGELSKDEALLEIRDTVRRMTYSDEYGPNYVFMSSYNGTMLVQPYEPNKEMTDMWKLRDIHGVYIIQELVRSAKENPQGGFVSYYYYPPNSQIPEEKLSYVVGIPELSVYIGTGTYMGKFYAQQTQLFTQMRWLLIAGIMLTGGAAILSIYRLYSNSQQLIREIGVRRKAQADVELSEQNLRAVFNGIYDSIFIHDYQGKILEVNQRMLQLFRVDQDWALRSNISEISEPQFLQKHSLREIWDQVYQGKEVLFEWKSLRPFDGSLFDAEVALRPVTWYGREAVLAVVRDISMRKLSELERQKNQLALEHSQELAHVGHYSVDLETHTRTWSKELYRIYGYDPSLPPPTEKEQRAMMLGRDWERINDLEIRAYQSGEIVNTEYRIRRPDGSIRHLNLMMDWGRNAEGKIITHTGTVQDITEQKEHEKVLQSSEERFRSVVEQMAEGLALINEDGTILTWNHALEEITRISRTKAVGEKIWIVQASVIALEKQSEELLQNLKTRFLNAAIDPASLLSNPEGSTYTIVTEGIQKTILQNTFPVITPSGNRIGMLVRDITDLKRSQERVQHELQKLNGLRQIDAHIVQQDSLTDVLKSVADQAQKLLKADAVYFMVMDPKTYQIKTTAGFGFSSNITDCQHFSLSTCLPWQTISKGKLMIQGKNEGCLQCDCFKDEGFNAVYCLPVEANNQVKGIVELFTRQPLPVDQEWEEYFEILAGQTAVALEKTTLFHDLQTSNTELNQAYEATIAGWSRALELRDKETKGHSERVMLLACELAQKINYPVEEMPHFRRGVLLHDIGKMGIPDSILLKPGPLTDDEWQIMRMHPDFAYHLLAEIDYLRPALDIPYCHHERWDGSGYPRGLKGEEIPLSARIFAVVDVWDALISDRPYRPAWPPARVRQYLLQNAGTTLDPDIVNEFLKLV